MVISSRLGMTDRWPKVFYVSCVSNASTLVLFYVPSMYGYHYYFINLLKMVPLILWLVYLARLDPSPNRAYRALCLVFILQIITGGWHIMSSLQSPYYDLLALTATVLELLVVATGGLNVGLSVVDRRKPNSVGLPAVDRRRASHVNHTRCSLWAKRNNQSRG